MKILFCMRHDGCYYRLFASTIRSLAERGHQVHLVFDTRKWDSGSLDALLEAHPNLSCGPAPAREQHWMRALARDVRATRDYLQYLGPAYKDASKLRQRASLGVSRRLRPLLDRRIASMPAVLRTLDALLKAVEEALPYSAAVERFIVEQDPDVVVVTPLVGLMPSVKSGEIGRAQVDYVRSAGALGIPTCLCVASWDNLTTKGLIRGDPDVVTVWNDAQKREAVKLHRIPAERVVVTGAPSFDEWFERRPSTTREEFCRAVGLRPDRPILLYLGSSRFSTPEEPPYVERWIRHLREAGHEALEDVGILIRPHPEYAVHWSDTTFAQHDQVSVWPPPESASQVTRKHWSKAEFYDSVHHSAAVVGVNTTAMIESAIIGRRAYTVVTPEFAHAQEGTLHFGYLLRESGGLLQTASTLEEHAAQLAEALDSDPSFEDVNGRFLEAFVRPRGLDVPASPVVAQAIERTTRAVPNRVPYRRWRALRLVLGGGNNRPQRGHAPRERPGHGSAALSRRVR
jgi:hypothetical protein